METFNGYITAISGFIYTYILIGLLIGAGIYFTIRTRGVQFRMFGHMWGTIMKSRSVEGNGISSFQAFAIGIASRVGTGNIMGVAVALILGGPGAIFWMWLIALLGMATAFIEATMAQMFKERSDDHTFRGGPAYYIQKGLRMRWLGIVFAVCLIFTFGFTYQMVQANTIAGVFAKTFSMSGWMVAVMLVILCLPIVLGGIRGVARVTEYLAPIMAAVYILLAIVIVGINIEKFPSVIAMIFTNAFTPMSAGGGLVGGLTAAVLNGAKRGLYSNEAGMGSAPNAAATATVAHPVQQGLIQSMGVFVDTILVCTSTAFICIVGGVYKPGVTTDDMGATLTQQSVVAQLGSWTTIPVAIIIFVFAYSSILGNHTYAEVNMDFIFGAGRGKYVVRGLSVVAVVLGSLMELTTAINLADISQASMAIINLIAIFLMGGWAIACLRDYEKQWKAIKRGETKTLHFRGVSNPDLPKDLPDSVWVEDEGVVPQA